MNSYGTVSIILYSSKEEIPLEGWVDDTNEDPIFAIVYDKSEDNNHTITPVGLYRHYSNSTWKLCVTYGGEEIELYLYNEHTVTQVPYPFM